VNSFDTWESYSYPETFDPDTGEATLRNLYQERDAQVLKAREYTQVAMRSAEISSGLAQIPQSFDAAHLKAIHQYLFQDLYEWAGEYRTVDITKGMTTFASANDGSIDRRLSNVQGLVASVSWSELERTAFVENASAVFAELNQAHPFREGNGRSAKVFMELLAETTPFELNWHAVPAPVWNQASEFSGPDLGAWKTHPEELHEVFGHIVVMRQEIPVESSTPPQD